MRNITHPSKWLAVPLLAAALIGLAGALSNRPVLRQNPAAVLRRG